MSVLAETLLATWRESASIFWRDMNPRNSLRPDQERVVDAVAEDALPHRVTVRAPRGWAKSATCALSGLHFLAVHPRSLVYAVTPTERQARSLFTEVQTAFFGSEMRKLFPDWRVGVASIETSDASHRFITASSDNPSNLESLHGENVLLIFDQAETLPGAFFSSALGCLAGARTTRVLATGTGGGTGWFFDSFGRDAAKWKGFHFTPENSPHLKEAIEAERERLGSDDPFFRRQYLAEFVPERDSAQLFDLADFEQCVDFDPYADEVWPTAKGRAIGVDPARSGDKTMLSFWHGRRLVELKQLPHQNLMETCGQIVNEQRRFRAREIGIDANGLGMGLADRLAEIYDAEPHQFSPQDRVHVLPFVAGSKASPAGAERFFNLKSEVAWNLKSMLEEQRIGFPGEVAERLLPDLLAERLETRSDGRLKVVDPPGRSPDALDAVLIGWWASQEGASPPVVCWNVPGA